MQTSGCGTHPDELEEELVPLDDELALPEELLEGLPLLEDEVPPAKAAAVLPAPDVPLLAAVTARRVVPLEPVAPAPDPVLT